MTYWYFRQFGLVNICIMHERCCWLRRRRISRTKTRYMYSMNLVLFKNVTSGKVEGVHRRRVVAPLDLRLLVETRFRASGCGQGILREGLWRSMSYYKTLRIHWNFCIWFSIFSSHLLYLHVHFQFREKDHREDLKKKKTFQNFRGAKDWSHGLLGWTWHYAGKLTALKLGQKTFSRSTRRKWMLCSNQSGILYSSQKGYYFFNFLKTYWKWNRTICIALRVINAGSYFRPICSSTKIGYLFTAQII